MTRQECDFSGAAMRAWVVSNLQHRVVSGSLDEVNLRKCPKCDDSKFHTFFNFRKKVGFCHKNECVFSFLEVMQEFYGPNLTLELAAGYLQEDFHDFSTCRGIDRTEALLEAMTLDDTPVGQQLKSHPDGYVPFKRDMDHPVLRYALTRNIPPEELYGGDFGFTDVEGVDRNRLIAIIRDGMGEPAGWQARAVMGQKPKYLYPPSSVTGTKVSDLVGRIHRCPDVGSTLVLNEGLFSAIASDLLDHDAYGVCMFGGHMSDTQKSTILQYYPKEVCIIQEPGVGDAKAMHRLVDFVKAGISSSVIKMPEGDPESHPKLYREMFSKRSFL